MLYVGIVCGCADSKYYDTGIFDEPLQIKSVKFLKRELEPEAWKWYKNDAAEGYRFFTDKNGSFYVAFPGDEPEKATSRNTSLMFLGDDLKEVNNFLLWR